MKNNCLFFLSAKEELKYKHNSINKTWNALSEIQMEILTVEDLKIPIIINVVSFLIFL